MKLTVLFFAFLMSLSAIAASGSRSMSILLEQADVEALEAQLVKKGFTLSKVQDVFATRGVYPRCPCTSMDLTFTRVNAGKPEEKIYNVYATGFGTSLDVAIRPVK